MSGVYRSHSHVFGAIGVFGSLETARAVVISSPMEYTVSYGMGAQGGPQAILDASVQVELYDETLDFIPAEYGLGTLAPLSFESLSHTQALALTEQAVAAVLEHGQLPVTIGGEHSLTPACVAAVQRHADYAPLGVLQFDAHGDLRNSYEDSPISHACAMRRCLDIPGVKVTGAGIRSISPEEIADIRAGVIDSTILYAHDLRSGKADLATAIDALPERVYITVDVDCFDPSIMPSTGTPEPGGLDWYTVLDGIRCCMQRKKIAGFDIVELAPVSGVHGPDFLSAKLLYRMFGMYIAFQEGIR